VFKRSLLVLACITLTACEEGDIAIGTIKDYGTTASGSINDAIKTGKSVTDGVVEMIEDAKKRIDQVQSGVNLLMQGKELIEEGVSGEEQE
jgi:hypothetical protein